MESIQVNIKSTTNRKVYKIQINKSDTIQKLKEECQKQTLIPIIYMELLFRGKNLSNERFVKDYKIKNNELIILNVSPNFNPNTNVDDGMFNKSQMQNDNNTINQNNETVFNTQFFQGMNDISQLQKLFKKEDANLVNNELENLGLNPNMFLQLFNDPIYKQAVNLFYQNPQFMELNLNNPMVKSMTENNPKLKALLNNKQIMQQMYSPENMKLMYNYFLELENNKNPNISNNNINTQNQLEIMKKIMQGAFGVNPLGYQNLPFFNIFGYNSMIAQNDMNTINPTNNMNTMNNINAINNMNTFNNMNMNNMNAMNNMNSMNNMNNMNNMNMNNMNNMNMNNMNMNNMNNMNMNNINNINNINMNMNNMNNMNMNSMNTMNNMNMNMNNMNNMVNMMNVMNDLNKNKKKDYKKLYKFQLEELNKIGFKDEEKNLQVLKQCHGDFGTALDILAN